MVEPVPSTDRLWCTSCNASQLSVRARCVAAMMCLDVVHGFCGVYCCVMALFLSFSDF
ncbi:hypothetical protein Hanom_Chr11g01048781 [Helianthus anomalus]